MPRGIYPHRHVKPKVYPAEMVAQVAALYEQGRTQGEIAAELAITQKVVWRLMVNHGIAARTAAKRDQSGTANHMWKGDDAGYQALHLRVEVERGTPSLCAACGQDDESVRYEWANLTGDYARVTDYVRLCVPCHRRFDGRRRAVMGERTSPVRGSA